MTAIVPHSIELEQELLGTCLMYGDVVEKVCDLIDEDEFYDPFHQEIFRSIVSLATDGLPATPATVVSKLRQIQAEIDVPAYVSRLITVAMPSSQAVGSAHVLSEIARKRRLQIVCNGVVDRISASDPKEPASDLIDEAERLIFALRPTDQQAAGFASFKTASEEAVRKAMEAFQRDDGVAGLSTGYAKLDEALGGFGSTDVIVLAGRPGSGKTSLAVNIAMNVAKRGQPVGMFSLEMSRDQVASREIAAEAGISGHVIRKGTADQTGIEAYVRAAQDLGNIPLWIDHTGNVPLSTVVMKARQLKRKHGLALLVIDYLQLMKGSSKGKRDENRVRDLTEITSGLKALAKEMECPVLCLSQLNRQVESRDPPRPMLSDLRECVTGDTRVVDARTGALIEVRNLSLGTMVLGLSFDMKVRAAPVADVWSTGVKPVFRVITKSGREIVATANHPFLTGRGWRPLCELQEDDRLAVPYRHTHASNDAPEASDLCRLLGYIAGNGSVQEHRTIGLIIPCDDAFADAVGIVERHWPEVKVKVRANSQNDAWISRVFENGHGAPFANPLREWLREIGVVGQRDRTKEVPRFVFEAGVTGAREFLAGYLETDGCVTSTHGRWSIRFDTTSWHLAQGVAELLTRIGVACVIGEPRVDAASTVPIYRIAIGQTEENLRRFAEMVPARGIRGRRLQSMVASLEPRATRNSLFVLPKGLATYIEANGWGRDQGKAVSRERAHALLAANDDPVLRSWAGSDVIWDEIRSIKPEGEKEVFDLSVPGLNNFVANGIVVHNSGSIEQDADMVLFLYREEYYLRQKRPRPGTEEFADWEESLAAAAGVAEVIVAKQRHGPASTVVMGFDAELTRFLDEPPVKEAKAKRKERYRLKAREFAVYDALMAMLDGQAKPCTAKLAPAGTMGVTSTQVYDEFAQRLVMVPGEDPEKFRANARKEFAAVLTALRNAGVIAAEKIDDSSSWLWRTDKEVKR